MCGLGDWRRTIVTDNGSVMSRVGFAGALDPEFVIPSVVGRPRCTDKRGTQSCYVGDDIASCQVPITRKYPLEHSVVTNWDDMEKLWAHMFNKLLQIDTTDHTLILTEPVMNPRANREKTTQIMFERFGCPALYIGAQPALCLRSAGRSTGLVVECGNSVSYIVPVYKGQSLDRCVMHMDIAGQGITEYLVRLLNEKGYAFTTSAELRLANEIKEKLCYTALNYNLEQKQTSLVRSYQSADGKLVKLGLERIKAPEVLFEPSLFPAASHNGIQWYVYNSIKKVQPELCETMFENIVISGGTANLPGFADRLAKEVKLLSPESLVKVKTPINSQHPSWHGASLLASLPEFEGMCVTIDEYDEYGPSISHSKFC